MKTPTFVLNACLIPFASHCRPLQDVSCNEIQALPAQVGRLQALRELNIRKNCLHMLPEGQSSSSTSTCSPACIHSAYSQRHCGIMTYMGIWFGAVIVWLWFLTCCHPCSQSWLTCLSSDLTSPAIRSQRSLQPTGSSGSCSTSSSTIILCSHHPLRQVHSPHKFSSCGWYVWAYVQSEHMSSINGSVVLLGLLPARSYLFGAPHLLAWCSSTI